MQSRTAPIVGSTPPSNPLDGDLWYNTATDWRMLMAWDAIRSKWLSVHRTLWAWGHDWTDGARLRGFGINIEGANAGVLVPRNACIVRGSARARTGGLTKGFNVLTNGVATHTFSLTNLKWIDNALDWDLNEGDDVWVDSQATGAASIDIAVALWVAWRWMP
jgi:hypothetical protein